MDELIRKENQIIWCKSCGMYSVFTQMLKKIKQLDLKKLVAVSGIGCAARSSGYFNFDSVNALHGRAIPIASGLKLANNELNVFVLSGDGDLLSIGLSHLIHCARRNLDITVFCANNRVYGLTGGQASPATKKGEITKTTPFGEEFEPVNIQKILMANKYYFYAKTNAYDIKHLSFCVEEAFKHKGFSFVEIEFACLSEWFARNKVQNHQQIREFFGKNKIVEEIRELKENEYGVNKC